MDQRFLRALFELTDHFMPLVTFYTPKTLREKCPNTKFFLVVIFPHSDRIRRDTEYLSVFCPNAGKYGPDNSEYKHFLRSGQLVFQILIFFFYQGFLSQTPANHRTTGEGRGPSFIPLCHFHPLTNIQTFICNFACQMTIPYF